MTTTTGRTPTGPVLQNLPMRTEEGKRIREAFRHTLKCFECNKSSLPGRSRPEAEMIANRDGWVRGHAKTTGNIEIFCGSCTDAADGVVNIMHQFDVF